MSEWKDYTIGQIVHTFLDFRGKTPKKLGMDWGDGNIPALSANNVEMGRINFRKECYLGSIELYNVWMNRGDCAQGDVVMTMEAPLGNVAQIPDNRKYILSQRVVLLKTNSQIINHDYLFFILAGENFQQKLIRESTGSTAVGIQQKRLEKLFISIPTSISEQRKIARILSSVNAVIEKTEAAIAKYKAIKAGMMRDLFTRGIDLKTGKLRPRYEDAPELYKESELGWVPKEWEIFILGLKGHFQNGVNKEKEAFGKGTLFANIIDAYPEILNCKTLGRVLITPSELDNYQLHKGDILFVRSSVKPEGVAYNTMFITCIEKVVFCGFMIRYRFENKIENIPSFYNFYFRSDDFRKTAIASSTVSANTNINQPALSRLSAVQPNQKEQKLIIEKITCISDLIDKEQLHLIKYKNIKSGLMSDLLTGKVRVKYNENEKVEVV